LAELNESLSTRAIPQELAERYGDKVPRNVLETWGRLKNPETKKSYLARLDADNPQRKAHVEAKPATEPPPIADAPEAESSPVSRPPESELDKARKEVARGDKWVLRSLLNIYHTGSPEEKIEALTLFANNKQTLDDAIGDTQLVRLNYFNELARFAEAYAPEIAQRNAAQGAEPLLASVQPEVAAPADSVPAAEAPKTGSDFLSQAEVDALLAGIGLSTPQSSADAATPLETDKQSEDLKNSPWNLEGGLRESYRLEFEKLYPPGQMIPPDILERYLALRDKQIESFESGDRTEQEKVVAEMEHFMREQRNADYERRSSGTQPAGETPIILNPDDAPHGILNSEGTRLEKQGKLRDLVEKLTETTRAVSERFTASKNYLNERAKEMDSKATEMGAVERYFRSFGEKYNKLSPIHKLGIGVTLGVGTAVGAAFSLPIALFGVSGLVIQRAAGAASMFLKIEKDLQTKKVGEKSNQFIGRKERAMLDATLYTAVMGVAINQGLELAREYNVVERTHEWLGGLFGHHPVPIIEGGAKIALSPAGGVPPQDSVAAVKPEVAQPATVAGTDEAAKIEVQKPAAAAVAGEQISQQIEKNIPGSEAPSSFEMPKHADFSYHGDEDMSVSPHDVTPAGANEFIDQDLDSAIPTDAETPDAEVPAAESVPAGAEEVQSIPEVTEEAEAVQTVASEAQPPEPLPVEKVSSPVYEKVDVTLGQTPAEVPAPAQEIITNNFGTKIPVAEPHIYAGTEQTFSYGGTHADRMKAMLQYFRENPKETIIGADPSGKYRVPWHFVDGEVTPAGMPVRTRGLFGSGFLSDFMKPPGPEDLQKIIK